MKIIGVYEVANEVECYLIEVDLGNSSESFDWSGVTQKSETQPRSNWQVAYDEQRVVIGENKWVFFFHYLDFKKPLLTPQYKLNLPLPTVLPNRLKHIKYEAP